MILQISAAFYPILLILYMSLIGIQFGFGIWMLVLYLHSKRESKTPVPYVLATCIFFILLAVGRVIFAWFDFVLTSFNDITYPTYAWAWKIASAITTVGLALFTYQLEKKPLQNKTRGILTVIVLVFVALMIVYPVNDLSSFNIAQYFIVGAIGPIMLTPFIYFYLAAQVPGYKATGVVIGVGMIVYFLGEAAIAEFVVLVIEDLGFTRELIYTMAQIFKSVGMVLIGAGFVRDLKR